MKLRRLASGLASVALVTSAVAVSESQAQETQFFPVLSYRTGPYAPNGIPSADGIVDYFALINERDGGVGGVKLTWEECEFGYNTKRGVECYERLKPKKPVIVFPYSTGLTYKLLPNAAKDKVVVLTVGYGRTDASDGRVFPWAFTTPATYWSAASALVKYIGQDLGGMAKLKRKKIALIYHNSAYGKEPIPTLQTLAKKYGYRLTLLAVDHPGQEQKATWLKIRRLRPHYILLWGWGVMNQVAVKEAANIGMVNRMLGVWWSGSEPDVAAAPKAATGYRAATFHGVGAHYPLHQDIMKFVYGRGKGTHKENVGTVLYNRGLVSALFATEAMRLAQKKFNVKVVNGDQMRWGMENLSISAARWKELGLAGFMPPVKNTCADHEGGTPVMVQRWDGKAWKIITEPIAPLREVVRPMIEASAAAFAKKNGITPRKCN